MLKKIIALSLTLALLAPIGAVQSTDSQSVTPTVEQERHVYAG